MYTEVACFPPHAWMEGSPTRKAATWRDSSGIEATACRADAPTCGPRTLIHARSNCQRYSSHRALSAGALPPLREEMSEQFVVRIAQGDLYRELSAVEPFGFAAPLGGHQSGRPAAGRVAEAAEDERPQGSSWNLICGSLAAQGGAEA